MRWRFVAGSSGRAGGMMDDMVAERKTISIQMHLKQ